MAADNEQEGNELGNGLCNGGPEWEMMRSANENGWGIFISQVQKAV